MKFDKKNKLFQALQRFLYLVSVKHTMGGELPEISQTTYDLIQEKLEQWKETSN